MFAQTCSLCHGVVSNKLASNCVRIIPSTLKSQRHWATASIVLSYFAVCRLFWSTNTIPATRTSSSVFPDNSTLVLHSPSRRMDQVIVKLRWLVVIDPVARTFEGPPRGFKWEFSHS